MIRRCPRCNIERAAVIWDSPTTGRCVPCIDQMNDDIWEKAFKKIPQAAQWVEAPKGFMGPFHIMEINALYASESWEEIMC